MKEGADITRWIEKVGSKVNDFLKKFEIAPLGSDMSTGILSLLIPPVATSVIMASKGQDNKERPSFDVIAQEIRKVGRHHRIYHKYTAQAIEFAKVILSTGLDVGSTREIARISLFHVLKGGKKPGIIVLSVPERITYYRIIKGLKVRGVDNKIQETLKSITSGLERRGVLLKTIDLVGAQNFIKKYSDRYGTPRKSKIAALFSLYCRYQGTQIPHQKMADTIGINLRTYRGVLNDAKSKMGSI